MKKTEIDYCYSKCMELLRSNITRTTTTGTIGVLLDGDLFNYDAMVEKLRRLPFMEENPAFISDDTSKDYDFGGCRWRLKC